MSATTTVDEQAVLEVAKQAFWDLGYDWTGIDVLELRSGVDRTTLHTRFGSKRDLLDAALNAYTESFIGPRLAGMEDPGAGVAAVVDFFTGLAAYFEQDPEARRGCLLVNVIIELASRDTLAERWGARFKARLGDAFRNALTRNSAGTTDGGEVVLPGSLREARAGWLVAQTLGLWLLVRFDPPAAAAAARAVAMEIGQWGAGA
ncbi:MAG: TetR/AcrR family transcriptional regulator [Actinomycetota bacterium]|jgi:TetR/AcrR family transcriptional regulator, transcriptional repressor for nem operon